MHPKTYTSTTDAQSVVYHSAVALLQSDRQDRLGSTIELWPLSGTKKTNLEICTDHMHFQMFLVQYANEACVSQCGRLSLMRPLSLLLGACVSVCTLYMIVGLMSIVFLHCHHFMFRSPPPLMPAWETCSSSAPAGTCASSRWTELVFTHF